MGLPVDLEGAASLPSAFDEGLPHFEVLGRGWDLGFVWEILEEALEAARVISYGLEGFGHFGGGLHLVVWTAGGGGGEAEIQDGDNGARSALQRDACFLLGRR